MRQIPVVNTGGVGCRVPAHPNTVAMISPRNILGDTMCKSALGRRLTG
ncbi:MAG TPA: hypothetical protein VGM82_19910 [Gemmatimonadaceae bacterium]|jgi:hypothetical protein